MMSRTTASPATGRRHGGEIPSHQRPARYRHDEPSHSPGRRRTILAVLSAAQFLTVLDLWVVNIALPALQHEFAPASLSDVSWILDVYAIVLAALLLPAGRAADRIGRRTCFLTGLVVFGAASLGCSLAPDLPVLIAFRVLQAAGAAMLMPTSLGLALSAFSSASAGKRGRSVGWGRCAGRWQRPSARRPADRLELALDFPDQRAGDSRGAGGRRRGLAVARRSACRSSPRRARYARQPANWLAHRQRGNGAGARRGGACVHGAD